MATYLVTGGAGFIGSELVRQLIAETDHRVINIDRLTYAGNLESLDSVRKDGRHVFVQVDIRDRKAIREVFEREQPDAVVHLAAETHVDRSIDGPELFVQTNVMGTLVMLDEALRHWRSMEGDRAASFRFVHVSTDEVFGALGDTGLFTEQTPYDPSSPYSASKAGADHLARAWHRTYRLPVVVTNCSNNFGPYQFPEKLIPLIIRKALRREPLPVYGRGENVRDWLHVADHARALRLAVERGTPGETYNVGAGNERRNIDVVRAICAILDSLVPEKGVSYENLITFTTDRPGHDYRYAIDATKIRRELGWAPRENFENALRKTVQWYMEHSDWIDHVAAEYRGERLGVNKA
jgi:dTDP-glucose 4,6-dehydratase